MRLSVLLPTREGGVLLAACITSVLNQSFKDLELVISDNANDDVTPEVLVRFADDPRVTIVRQERVVGVANNWNAALEASTGDYCLMIGDDDYLLPDCAARLCESLCDGEPDCITYNAITYVFPSAIRGVGTSHCRDPHFRFPHSLLSERDLSAASRLGVVRDMFRFRPRLPLNMQTTVFSRRAIGRLGPEPFKAPFPDHYALNGMLLTAKSWRVIPDQLLIIGVSPKSFGHYVYSGEDGAGMSYLGIDAEFNGKLPGSELMNAMHIWLGLLLRDFPDELSGVSVSRGDYVTRQVWAILQARRLGLISTATLIARLRTLDPRDWLRAFAVVADPEVRALVRSRLQPLSRDRASLVWSGLRPIGSVSNIAEFSEWWTAQSSPAGSTAGDPVA